MVLAVICDECSVATIRSSGVNDEKYCGLILVASAGCWFRLVHAVGWMVEAGAKPT